MPHVSQPYVTVGRVIDLYISSLLAALRSLFFRSFVFANKLNRSYRHVLIEIHFNFHSCTVHLDTIQSIIYPSDAQIDCSKKMLKFTLKFT